VDPFHRGRELTEEECRKLVRNVYGRRTPFKEHFLDPITPRQLIQRLLLNLKAGYLQRGDEDRAGRVIELLLAMYPWDLDEVRDRGMLRERVGEYVAALTDLEQYVQFRVGARDLRTVNETVRSLRRQTGAAER
jgi:regulator of sirC expression with transglutaminase-like and TPR domain